MGTGSHIGAGAVIYYSNKDRENGVLLERVRCHQDVPTLRL